MISSMKLTWIHILIFSILIILIISMAYKIVPEKFSIADKLYYFDNNASTNVDDMVQKEVCEWLSCGNPSNVLHIAGSKAHKKIADSREIVAKDFGVDPKEIFFTSGATESNNIIIQGIINSFLSKNKKDKCTVITSAFEHPSVLNVFKHYKDNDRVNIVFVPIQTNKKFDYYGSIDPNAVEQAIISSKYPVILVSIMYANNETGAIQDLKKIGEITKRHKVYFHSDATQGIGKYHIKPYELNLDAMSCSGHKFHAPKGIGILYMRGPCDKCENLSYGGEQELSKRPGTENVAFIAGIAKALELVHFNRKHKNDTLIQYKEMIKKQLDPRCEFIESTFGDLPNTILAILPPIKVCNKVFAKDLSDTFNICIGVSSACQTGKTSHVLEALNISESLRDRVIRISMSDQTTHGDCRYLIVGINALINKHSEKYNKK